jgi:hypothetical protein
MKSVALIHLGSQYFELHRGTYTSQAKNKYYNRKTEFLLRDVELLSVLASQLRSQYPKSELDRLWKLVLLNQFHDVLPGSSIELVYDDSTKQYKDVIASGTKLKHKALEILFKNFVHPTKSEVKLDEKNIEELLNVCICAIPTLLRPLLSNVAKENFSLFSVNTLGVSRAEIIEVDLPEGVKASQLAFAQSTALGNKGLVAVEMLPFSVTTQPVNRGDLPKASGTEFTAQT